MPYYSKFFALLTILKRDIKLILTITFVVVFWACVYLTTAFSPEFVSNSRIWIKRAGQASLISHSSDEFNQASISPVAQAGNIILTQMEVLKSTQISDALTAYVNQYYPAENPTKKRINVQKHLKLKNKIGTDIIEVDFSWRNPRLAQLFLGQVIQKYQDVVNDSTNELKKNRREFLDATAADLEHELLDVSKLIKAYKKEHGIVTITSAQEQWATEMEEAQSALTTVKMEKAGAYNKLRDIQNQLGVHGAKSLASSVITYDNRALIQLQEALNKATSDYLEKRAVWSDDNPKLVALKDKVEYLEAEIAKLNGSVSSQNGLHINDPVKAEMAKNLVTSQNSYQDYSAKEAALEQSIQQLQQKATLLPTNEYELAQLESKRIVLEEAYKALKTQQIEARMSEAQDFLNNIFVIDKPSYNPTPLPPSRPQYLIFALFAGLSLGGATSILKHKLKQQLISSHDITSITRKPILGRIPWYANRSEYRAEQKNLQFAYQNIVSSLQHRVIQPNCKVLVFASPRVNQDRQSTFTFDIANLFANLDYKVALVDCNPQRNDFLLERADSAKIKTYDLSNTLFVEQDSYTSPAESAVLVRTKQQTSTNNLTVFCNTQPINEPFQLYNSTAYQEWFTHQLANHYDLVIADVPIGYQAPEFPVIAKKSDAVVLLLKYDLEPAELKETVHLLEEWDINLAGSIIRDNNRKLSV